MTNEKQESSELLPLVYERLRKFATSCLTENDSLFGTGLVHEGYLRVASLKTWESQAHFYRAIRMAMRNAIVDHLRKKSAEKRGGHRNRISFDDAGTSAPVDLPEIVRLSDSLDQLATHDQRAASVVTLRFFGCMSEVEIAEELNVSRRTVQRDWIYAKTWLRREME